ncbi:MAG: hypothetical protein GXO96_07370, partial [Nitrospirae bacterium]|nr:hypothetical protein [Candidatus Manganitrophaceae bacterium]
KQVQKIPPPILEWLKSLEKTAISLLEIHPESRKIETLLETARICFRSIGKQGDEEGATTEFSESSIQQLQNGKVSQVKGWQEEEFKTAQNLIKIAQQLLRVDETRVRPLRIAQTFCGAFSRKSPSGSVGFI